MESLNAPYVTLYAVSWGSVLLLVAAILSKGRKTGVDLSPSRLLLLTREETRRLTTADSVYLMHLSIAVGVGLSILIAILYPVFFLLPLVRTVLLVFTVPLLGGLVAAFAWRIRRYMQSKRVEKELMHSSSTFSSASTRLQLVLILAIALTTTELVLTWLPGLAALDLGLNIVRNGLVAIYYASPSINLLQSFDLPLSAVRVPFKLSDVVEGKVDSSQTTMGVSKMSEFAGFQRLSYNSCVEIGACEAACPATAAGRRLSPRVLVRELSLQEGRNGEGSDPMAALTEEELWACTTCGACMHACPVAVKHLDVIYDLRRNLVSLGRLDREKSTLLLNLTQTQNPYGFAPQSRADWAKENGIETLASNPKAEYLYWVGCVSSFDQRAQSVAKSLAKILKTADLSFAILGSEEACTGDPARRLGEEGRYQELAGQNIERMNGYGVRKVITACPHCFNAIKNEYRVFGGNYEVVHHTQLISQLIKEKRLNVSPEKLREISVTLHDACYAARYNNIFDEPREALSATGASLHEMHRTKEKTFCCGAGGSNYWYKAPQQRSISGIRTEEAKSTGAKTIATECPFCLSMFEDSTKVSETEMDVRDVAEIVADGIL